MKSPAQINYLHTACTYIWKQLSLIPFILSVLKFLAHVASNDKSRPGKKNFLLIPNSSTDTCIQNVTVTLLVIWTMECAMGLVSAAVSLMLTRHRPGVTSVKLAIGTLVLTTPWAAKVCIHIVLCGPYSI